jgi:hypothetical protein
VINFTNPSMQSSSGFSSAFSDTPFIFCSGCREGMRGGGVVTCCLDCFLEGNNLCLFAYSVPWLFYNASNIGIQDTCSMEDADPPEMVLGRANLLLDHGGFGEYNVALKNCFDFAFYCKTGKRYFSMLDLVVNGPPTSPVAVQPPKTCTIV